MRVLVALALVILVAPTFASAARSDDSQRLSVTIVALDQLGTAVSWSPAVGPVVYEIYRGPGPDDLTLVGKTPTTSFFDENTPPGMLYYLVIATLGAHAKHTGSGDCIASRGTTGYSVTLAHCMPSDGGL